MTRSSRRFPSCAPAGLLVDDTELQQQLRALTVVEENARLGLTPAELRLLPLLATHLSFREIADQLALSRNTVKTQAISITASSARRVGATQSTRQPAWTRPRGRLTWPPGSTVSPGIPAPSTPAPRQPDGAPSLPFKIFAPKLLDSWSLRSGTVSRPGLVNRLRANSAFPVVTIVAPAGYGKTTLLAQWAERDARPFAWISLDEHDDDALVLLRHVAAALHVVRPLDESVLDALAVPADSIWVSVLPRLHVAPLCPGHGRPVVDNATSCARASRPRRS